MTMGSRIRQARMEAGLSQRQLAGDMMTRNMLSALEHDGANPSLTTLNYLSEKLCKPVSYFLGEDVPEIPNIRQMERVRDHQKKGEYEACLKEMDQIPESVFQPELSLVKALCLLELARKAREAGKHPYCRELLRSCEDEIRACPYMKEALTDAWLLESALAAPEKERAKYARMIASQDEGLLLRAEAAMRDGDFTKAQNLLNAVEDQNRERFHLQQGDLLFAQQKYAKAAEYYHRIEARHLENLAKKLEICYREMGNYKMAYYYAKVGK